MYFRKIWFWGGVAAFLFAAILVLHFVRPKEPSGPGKLLSKLKPEAVSEIRIHPSGQSEIRAVRTNGNWLLVAPLNYPAQAVTMDNLLQQLQNLVPAVYISPGELKSRPEAQAEFGLQTPQMAIDIAAPDFHGGLLIGNKTGPGDQLYVQRTGDRGIDIVSTDILKFFPRNVNELRDTTFIDVKEGAIDRVAVTNGTRFFELDREPVTKTWRMNQPIAARADSTRVEELLRKLNSIRVLQFITDDLNADMDQYRLQPAELELGFRQGTNILALLKFGKSPTNDASLVYARRSSRPGVVTVARDLMAQWQASINELRDPHLLSLSEPVGQIEVVGPPQTFSLERQTNDTWRVLPDGFSADAALTQGLLGALADIRIIEFTKDIVTPNDLPTYGLATPSRKFILRSISTPTPSGSSTTNRTLVELEFGANANDRVYVRRADESSVYAISTNDFLRLPDRSLQMRDRQVWNIREDTIAVVTISQRGRVRKLVRQAAHQWSLAPGSQGVINELAIEETVRPLCRLTAAFWVDRGAANREKFGFSADGHQVTLETKTGEKFTLELGAQATADSVFGAVMLNGEPWIFIVPGSIYRFIHTYLTIPDAPL